MIATVSRMRALSPSRWMAGLVALLAIAACSTTPEGPRGPVSPQPSSPVIGEAPPPATLPVPIADPAFTPVHMRGQADIARVAILLPFSADNEAARREATSILRAAELALFERAGENVLLLPKDTGGTAQGAREAARSALSDGAQLILGPLFSHSVEAVGSVARESSVPVIAFSTELSVAGDGVYLLSFPPGEEVRRIVNYTAGLGTTRYAVIGPANEYGTTVAAAYRDAIAEQPGGARLVAEEVYSGGVQAMNEAATRLARMGVEPLDAEEAAQRSGRNWEPDETAPFQVILLPESGDRLRTLAPVLVYQDIDPLLIKFVGTGQWHDSATVREPALANGWFAGPDPQARARFEAAFERVFENTPSRLAGLGYDAGSLAALMAASGSQGFQASAIESEEGFLGVDGLFRFREDGTIERGLAVYTVRSGGFEVLEPAPAYFGEGRVLEDPAGPATDIDAAESF